MLEIVILKFSYKLDLQFNLNFNFNFNFNFKCNFNFELKRAIEAYELRYKWDS